LEWPSQGQDQRTKLFLFENFLKGGADGLARYSSSFPGR